MLFVVHPMRNNLPCKSGCCDITFFSRMIFWKKLWKGRGETIGPKHRSRRHLAAPAQTAHSLHAVGLSIHVATARWRQNQSFGLHTQYHSRSYYKKTPRHRSTTKTAVWFYAVISWRSAHSRIRNGFESLNWTFCDLGGRERGLEKLRISLPREDSVGRSRSPQQRRLPSRPWADFAVLQRTESGSPPPPLPPRASSTVSIHLEKESQLLALNKRTPRKTPPT